MFCQKCGYPVGEEDKFCSACGAPVEEKKEQQAVMAEEEKSRYKKNTGWIVGTICAAGMVIIIVLFVLVTVMGTNLVKKYSKSRDFYSYQEDSQKDPDDWNFHSEGDDYYSYGDFF